MGRIAIGIEYDGAAFHGWQRQSDAISVQQVVEEALGQVADTTVELVCAGRTDAGVHALGQVAHIKLRESRKKYTPLDPEVNIMALPNLLGLREIFCIARKAVLISKSFENGNQAAM